MMSDLNFPFDRFASAPSGSYVVSQSRATVAARQPAGPPINPWGLPSGNGPPYFHVNMPMPPAASYAQFQYPHPQLVIYTYCLVILPSKLFC